jgi:transmembrane sensor
MDEVILKALSGRATVEENSRLAEWRRSDPENEAHARELECLWEATDGFAGRPAAAPLSVADIVGARSKVTRPAPSTGGRWRRLLPTLAAAASLVIVFGTTWLLSRPNGANNAIQLDVVTASGEMSTARLPDGTIVRLSPGSTLRVSGEAGVRSVTLEGRAFFAVAHERERPFTIRSRGGEVQVLGTRLEVTALEDELAVAVIEGEVAVSSDAGHVVLAAGDRTSNSAALVVESGQPSVPEWLGSFAAFQTTPLAAVAVEMEQRFNMTVRIEDVSLRNRTVTAWFVDTSAEDIMRAICQVTDVRCTITETITTIRSR